MTNVMRLDDGLVQMREALIAHLAGFQVDVVLNPTAGRRGSLTALELGEAIRTTANRLKSEYMDVAGGRVDYVRLRHSSAYAIYRNEITPQLQQLDIGTLNRREERLAFWINLYNALVIDAVASFGVQNSVLDGRFGLLAFFRRAAYQIDGHRFSLNDIEHGILRGNRGHWAIPGRQFGAADPRRAWQVAPVDPRIHCALNCASLSCPPIRIFDPDSIDAQLDLAARSFIASDARFDPDAGVVHLSAIFRWYAGDFGGRSGVLAFVAAHVPDENLSKWLVEHAGSVRISYHPYDWGLNQASLPTNQDKQPDQPAAG